MIQAPQVPTVGAHGPSPCLHPQVAVTVGRPRAPDMRSGAHRPFNPGPCCSQRREWLFLPVSPHRRCGPEEKCSGGHGLGCRWGPPIREEVEVWGRVQDGARAACSLRRGHGKASEIHLRRCDQLVFSRGSRKFSGERTVCPANGTPRRPRAKCKKWRWSPTSHRTRKLTQCGAKTCVFTAKNTEPLEGNGYVFMTLNLPRS